MKFKNRFPNVYIWCCSHLPKRLMYVERSIDSQHTMWFPRWGLNDKQIEMAYERAAELEKKLNEKITWG